MGDLSRCSHSECKTDGVTTDSARQAAVDTALRLIRPGATMGFGSGRAVFALVDALGLRPTEAKAMRAVVASEVTGQRAIKAGIQVVDLNEVSSVDIAFDGADEVDPQMRLIKGGGAALLREKIVLRAANQVIIMAEAGKQVERLGQGRDLPVEIVRFGWKTTEQRVSSLAGGARLRCTPEQTPVITDEGHYLLDVPLPEQDLTNFATELKQVVGVVEHGLFLDEADKIILGETDGSSRTLTRN